MANSKKSRAQSNLPHVPTKRDRSMDDKPFKISVGRSNESGKMISLTFFGQANKDRKSSKESSKESSTKYLNNI